MERPSILTGNSPKHFAWGLALGIVGTLFGGFYLYDWKLAGTANNMVIAAKKEGALNVYAAACAAQLAERPDYEAMQAALKSSSSWSRSSVFKDDNAKKLITLPGERSTDSGLANACADIVLKLKKN